MMTGFKDCAYVGRFSLPFLGIKDTDLNKTIWGRQVDYIKKINEWKKTAKKAYITQKRQSFAAAIKEFKDLYKPTAWFTSTKPKNPSSYYYDDSIEIYYLD